ncbi:hypothetical protein CBM2608_A50052 [Cupriavidus taiwanensis]|nr:hypothetical protein CBM2608_A50052 [Cupriavidus taiwanensis]
MRQAPKGRVSVGVWASPVPRRGCPQPCAVGSGLVHTGCTKKHYFYLRCLVRFSRAVLLRLMREWTPARELTFAPEGGLRVDTLWNVRQQIAHKRAKGCSGGKILPAVTDGFLGTPPTVA